MIDTLEHVQDPTLAMHEVSRVIRPGGLVVLSTPMHFPIHNHPWDYWRFTPAAADLLLRPFDSRAVFFQGDPAIPQTVLGLGQKAAPDAAEFAFESRVAALIAQWPEDTFEGPLLRFEPLLDAVVHERDPFQEGERTLPPLLPGHRVEQTFVCPAGNLRRIDVKFNAHDRVNFSWLALELRDETANGLVLETRYYAPHVKSHVWVPFVFPIVPDSRGHRYRLTLTTEDARPESALSPVVSDDPPGDDERLYEDGRAIDGTLCFRALCREEDYSVADYRALSGKRAMLATGSNAAAAPEAGGAVKAVSARQAEQLWYVVSTLERRIDGVQKHIDALQSATADVLDRLQKVLFFIDDVRASAPFRLASRARRIIGRK